MPAATGLRFKVDENLPGELSELLVAAGFDSTTVHGQGMSGAADEAVAEVCRSENRTLVTLDVGFGDVRLYPPAKQSGIVLFRLRRNDTPWILSVARSLLPALRQAPGIAGQLWVVTEHEVRIRESS